jgi:predicted nicotinamide N-methyase
LTDLEYELRNRFSVEPRLFEHGGRLLEMILPAAPEELIDESAFNIDERLPYWAELWPSARALARHLLDAGPGTGRIIELGCGLALPSLVILESAESILATDYYREALDFARANAERNRLPALATRLLDWRDPPAGLGTFRTALAADVLYEARNADSLSQLLPRIIEPGGSLLLADPGRTYRGAFERAMKQQGWTNEVEAELTEPSTEEAEGPVSRILIVRYRAPLEAPRR